MSLFQRTFCMDLYLKQLNVTYFFIFLLYNLKKRKFNDVIFYRATLLLVPLLGINYLLIPARPNKGSPWEPAYEYISAITTSLQVIIINIIIPHSSKDFFP